MFIIILSIFSKTIPSFVFDVYRKLIQSGRRVIIFKSKGRIKMSAISGLSSNSYSYVPVSYTQDTADETDTASSAQNSDTVISGKNTSGTQVSTSSSSSSGSDLSASVLASLLTIKANSVSTLLEALNNNSNSSSVTDDSLFNILKLLRK